MGNKNIDLPEPATSVAEFAAQLRKLREQAGSPPFRELAGRTHYSASTLAEATSGKRLPTEAVVKAFATECGGDADEWVARLRAVRAVAAREPSDPDGEPRTPPSTWSRPTALLAAVGTFAVGAVAGGLVMGMRQPTVRLQSDTAVPFTAVPTAAPSGVDGADPNQAGCAADAGLADKTPVMLDGRQVGALELAYSPHCRAAWARLYLYPGQPTMMGQVTVTAGDGRLSAIAEPLIKQVDDYTNVIQPGTGGCVGAQAVVLATGHNPVTASIPCQAPNKLGTLSR